MEKDQIIILEDRGIISVIGKDSKEFLQNIITNDINKVNASNTIFSGIFTPQGKYLFEFFLIKSETGYYLECDSEFTNEIINYLKKYILRSNVEIKDVSGKFVVGVINKDKFEEIKIKEKKNNQTIFFRSSPLFEDPRSSKLGARILSNLENLYLTIKKLSLKIADKSEYFRIAHLNGIPIKGLRNLQNNLFGLEANFDELSAIDFKKGCYIGQENTARMKLKNKIRRKLLALKVDKEIKIGSDIIFNNISIGKVLISNPLPFGLIKLFDPDLSKFKNEFLDIDKEKVKII